MTLSFGFQLFATFLITLIIIKLLIKYAAKFKLIDVPNHRSVHTNITPRGAGIGIITGLIVSDWLFYENAMMEHLAIYLAVLLVFFIGVLDDRHDAKPKWKFGVIFLSTLLLYFNGISIDTLGKFFGHDLALAWMALPFTFFAIAGFTNALNLVDGLDGLAGGISIVILSTLFMIGLEQNDFFLIQVSLSLIVAILAFLVFNWNPAKIFMGDSGSLTIGFLIALLAIKALPYIQPTSVLFIAAIPIMDTLIVMTRRLKNGKSPFSPDKLHMHHLLLKFFKGNVKKTVVFLIMLQLLYSLLGLNFSDYAYQRYTLVLFVLNTMIFYMLFNGMIDRQNKFERYRKKHK